MKRQVEMENIMLKGHREFMTNLEKAVEIIEQELKDAAELTKVCTGEWCRAVESVIDDLHKSVYSISEPRFATEEDTKRLRNLRCRVRDAYALLSGHLKTARAA